MSLQPLRLGARVSTQTFWDFVLLLEQENAEKGL